MGDRVYASIRISKADWKKEYEGYFDSVHASEANTIFAYSYEANYGALGIEEELHEKEIEYDKYYEGGGEFSAADEYARHTKNGYVIWEVTSEERYHLIELKQYIKATKADPIKLMKRIYQAIEEIEPYTPTPLGETNSVKFIKNASKKSKK